MPDDVARLPWTDEQWASVQRLVHEAAGKARVASSFLPLVGPLPPGQATIPALTLTENTAPPQAWYGTAPNRLAIDDGATLTLTTIACEVHLSTQQAEDPDLASAKQMLGRAADVIGRLEDAIVFTQPSQGPAVLTTTLPDIFTVQGTPQTGLLYAAPATASGNVDRVTAGISSDSLVSAVVAGIQALEEKGHFGPFACVLGHDLYQAAIAPSFGSFVVASDRIIPFLEGGPLKRSSVVPREEGLIVSLAGSPVDLVVATDVHVKFLQISLEPRYVLRVSERFVLRVKQSEAIYCLKTEVVPDDPDQDSSSQDDDTQVETP